jgi:hypothetical protein
VFLGVLCGSIPSTVNNELPYRAIPGIEAWRLAAGSPLRVQISREPAPASSQQVSAEWARLRAENPRHYDGPVLGVLSFDVATNQVLCRRDRYERLAVQPRVPTGVRQLAVTGLLMATDASGRPHVLLGRRGEATRIFGGMWEAGPSGGISPPPLNVEQLSEADLKAHLADEIAEEVGLETVPGVPVALLRDHTACSDDIVFRCDLGALEQVECLGPANWEYSQTRWLAVDDVESFDSAEQDQVIAATRALFRVLGWIDES